MGCDKKKDAISKDKAAIYFEAVPADSSGIHFTNQLTPSADLNIIEYLYYYNGGGVAIGDINNDGLDDIYFTANQTPDKLFLNLGNLKFKEITKEAGILIDNTWSSGVTMEDINNDGLLDIYVSKVGNYKNLKAHNLLYINKGNNTFEESAKTYGLDFSGLSTQAAFLDYDNDGDMDVYLMNHSIHTPRSYGSSSKREISDDLAGDRFYENKLEEGIIKFVDVTENSGIFSSALGYGLAITTSDINNDGYIDIYIGNDFHENDYLYINQGDKTFKESIASYISHTSRFTMGVDIADLNNDLNQDIFSLDMMPFDHEIFLKSGGEDTDKIAQIKKNYGFETQYARNTLQLNRGNNTFAEIALMTETHATDWSWSTLIQDFDNDSFNDIYITNGIYKRSNDLDYISYLSNVDFSEYNQTKQNELELKLIEEMPTIKLSNIIFRNTGNLKFEKLTETAGQFPSYSNGSAYSDLDNDGDLDIVINTINEPALLLENKSPEIIKNNYIGFSLVGDREFKNTTGSKVYLFADGKQFYKELTVTKGFQSSSSRKINFGLGAINKIDSVKVYWLDGKIQLVKNLPINTYHRISRNMDLKEESISKNKIETKVNPFIYTHFENTFVDYEREALMPEKLSSEGPVGVSADFNGDGLDDLYIGGARNQAPLLLLKQYDGTFTEDPKNKFTQEIPYEDVDAIAFDLENDGDLDLYVMSGGNEWGEQDASYEDRLYINDGNGKLNRFPASLIKTNGGSISVGDFDGDGFNDIFIGNRSVPGAYGLSPYSYILKSNQKGSFTIVEQFRFGMVTDSQWADLNNDKLLDLILVGDWMPITILINQGNDKFKDETKAYGLADSYGMWNTVAVADIDNNGRLDILGGNAGLNFKIKATPENPMKLFIDDFDNNGQPDPIIFYDFFGNNVPFASKDKLVQQLPYLKKKFLDYNSFSKINSITDLTGKEEKDIMEIKKITELRSMIYLNPGSDNFKAVPLPTEAQMSSIEDFYIDSSKKSKKIIFVGNYLDYTVELGNSDANSGGILNFDATGSLISFEYLPIPNSINARQIIKLEETKYLVLVNNDGAFTFEVLK
ncbi:FG-GAP repeat-containing protein [Cellulophaga tyrosinoxydans]|uniref:FG-GAP repeat-containing protein n=2 Tax=Cellulophaga tyrosinoxydans TaxID=504486 RepID=A0A1W1Z9J4_9FLAO|nr:FG-GAP repeat-containing protein [Cellulophaga tyrosinoxydans]